MAYYASSPPDPRLAITNPAAFTAQMNDWTNYLHQAQTLAPVVASIPGIYVIPGAAGAALREATNTLHITQGAIDYGQHEIRETIGDITQGVKDVGTGVAQGTFWTGLGGAAGIGLGTVIALAAGYYLLKKMD